ncbi:BspA family leucine-rich repeat surface protein [Campylobacter sp. RM5063]|nr:BspA family leucine-rich repeat surface protein [Campylobacter sp. RM5063]
MHCWDVSNVLWMEYAFFCESIFKIPFSKTPKFNQDLNNWNIDSVISTQNMFSGCINFNQKLSNWNLENIPRKKIYVFNTAIKINIKTIFLLDLK